jgi:molybdate transport system ATP-binding protein
VSTPRLDLRLRMRLAPFELDVELATSARTLGAFGPSGAGKTSLLEALGGWRAVEAGSLEFDGDVWLDTKRRIRVAPSKRGIGYVPQDLLLFPHWNVERNVLAGVERGGAADFERVLAVLELRELRERDIATLSGGEKQRVALARALCSRPKLLLLDEPLGSLDKALRRRILPYLLRVRDEFGVPMILVSHDATEVAALCDEVVLLRAGRIVARGAPSAVFASDEGWRAVGDEFENVLSGAVGAVSASTATIEFGGAQLEVPRSSLEVGQRAVVSVRADDVLVATEHPRGLSARNVLAARIEQVFGASEARVLARLLESDTALWIDLTPGAIRELALTPGRDVFVVIKTRSCRVLSARGA